MINICSRLLLSKIAQVTCQSFRLLNNQKVPILSQPLTKSTFCSQTNNQKTQQKKQKALPTFSQLQCKQLILQPNQLRDLMLQQINQFGELKLEKYWQLALTDSEFGYYRQSNVFSKEGDFTTSPQISPLFGQMIAVWMTYFLHKVGIVDDKNTVTKKFRIIQLGPGRGLLMRDIIKSLHEMKIDNYFDINFIEVSEYNRKCQQDNVFEQFKKYDSYFKFEFESQNKQIQSFKNEDEFQDINIKWFPNLQLMIKEDYDLLKQGKQLPFTIFLMNQYFDALPTTVYEYTENGWREKVIVKSLNNEMPLQFKNSTRQVPQKFRPLVKNPSIGDRIEVSHQSLIAIDTMAKLLLHTKGAILNIDYGDQHAFSNSIRAIKQHKFIPDPYFWQIPGKCDLSAYVNFDALGQFAQMNYSIKATQAIPQGYFLQAMGINPRIQILQKNMNQEEKQKLQSEYHRLTHPSQMGQNFKVQLITLKQYGELYPWITEKQGVY